MRTTENKTIKWMRELMHIFIDTVSDFFTIITSSFDKIDECRCCDIINRYVAIVSILLDQIRIDTSIDGCLCRQYADMSLYMFIAKCFDARDSDRKYFLVGVLLLPCFDSVCRCCITCQYHYRRSTIEQSMESGKGQFFYFFRCFSAIRTVFAISEKDIIVCRIEFSKILHTL